MRERSDYTVFLLLLFISLVSIFKFILNQHILKALSDLTLTSVSDKRCRAAVL